MLVAVREGRKTVTRRRIKPQPVVDYIGGQDYLTWVANPDAEGEEQGGMHNWRNPVDFATQLTDFCPFGQVGDTLRVQEDPGILLEIVELRAERVQAITEEDAEAEGVAADGPYGHLGATYREPFIRLYQSIYGVDSWQHNEWVWVVVFRPTTQTAKKCPYPHCHVDEGTGCQAGYHTSAECPHFRQE